MAPDLTRREFISRAALSIAAMHAPLLHAAPVETVSSDVHLDRIRIRANNLEELSDYYGTVLGLPVLDSSPELLSVRAGSSILEFSPDADHDRPFYHIAFTIPENRLESAMAWLESRSSIMVLNPRGDTVMHFKSWNAHSCYFLDPAGNILEFIAHHGLANRVAHEFSIDDVVRISEIGMVAPDVGAFESHMKSQLGLAPYISSSPVFSPIGDVGGLLITVRERRIWLGSGGTRAAVFPTEVFLESSNAAVTTEVSGLPYTIHQESRG